MKYEYIFRMTTSNLETACVWIGSYIDSVAAEKVAEKAQDRLARAQKFGWNTVTVSVNTSEAARFFQAVLDEEDIEYRYEVERIWWNSNS